MTPRPGRRHPDTRRPARSIGVISVISWRHLCVEVDKVFLCVEEAFFGRLMERGRDAVGVPSAKGVGRGATVGVGFCPSRRRTGGKELEVIRAISAANGAHLLRGLAGFVR